MKVSDKKRVYVDMDGVLCNFYKAAKQALTENPNQKYPQSQWGFFLKLEEIPGAIEGSIWLIAKVLVFLYIYVWMRATLPRFRYDQLMDLGWKILIPASLGWFMLMAILRLGRDEDWNAGLVAIVAAVVILGCVALMSTAIKVSKANREREGAMF